jgi:integrase
MRNGLLGLLALFLVVDGRALPHVSRLIGRGAEEQVDALPIRPMLAVGTCGPHDPPLRFQLGHELRHAAASLMLAQGVGAKVVAEVLGHAGVTVTLRVYAHLMPSAQQEAVAAMDRLFRAR